MRPPTEQEIAACFFIEKQLPRIIDRHLAFMAGQLVDSTIPTTRAYWRSRLGFPDAGADPRPLATVLQERQP